MQGNQKKSEREISMYTCIHTSYNQQTHKYLICRVNFLYKHMECTSIVFNMISLCKKKNLCNVWCEKQRFTLTIFDNSIILDNSSEGNKKQTVYKRPGNWTPAWMVWVYRHFQLDVRSARQVSRKPRAKIAKITQLSYADRFAMRQRSRLWLKHCFEMIWHLNARSSGIADTMMRQDYAKHPEICHMCMHLPAFRAWENAFLLVAKIWKRSLPCCKARLLNF